MPQIDIYRFSLWTTLSPCRAWLEHFRKKGVPAAIIENVGHSNDRFSVWRAGKEECVRPKDKTARQQDEFSSSFRIVESVHKFKMGREEGHGS